MTIPCLDLISNFRKARPKQMPERPHLFMAGLNQKVFLNQWGEPETQIGLKRLGSFNKLGSFFLTEDSAGEVHHSVWIYKKRDRILFFTKKKLISHSRWSEFRERGREPKEEPGGRSPTKSSPFLTTTFSLVA